MERFTALLVAIVIAAGVVASSRSSSVHRDEDAAAISEGKLPAAYHDWRLISVAREEGQLDDIRAVLGNEAAIQAYRDGTRPFPDGTIIARLAWSYDASEDNNRIFGSHQSFVAGHPKNGV